MRIRIFAIVLSLTPYGVAQDVWSTSHPAPAGDEEARMCWHEADQKVVALTSRRAYVSYGGVTLPGFEFETWERDGARWQQRHPDAHPRWRADSRIAYDARRRVVVLFGGDDPIDGARDDTWEWDGVRWTECQTVNRPPARHGHAMAYDAARRRIVLFGGADSNGLPLGDRWEWNGLDWQPVAASSPSPGPRVGAVLVHDVKRRVLLLYGGHDASTTFDDVWEHDGAQWTQHTPTPRPPAMESMSMVYDPHAKRAVLVGGITVASGSPNLDLWDWDGVQWQQVSISAHPGSRRTPGLAYDAVHRQLLVHGGARDDATWIWKRGATTWRRVDPATPRVGDDALAAFDWDGRTLYGFGDEWHTWDHREQRWSHVHSTLGPDLEHAALTFDAARLQGVLFGRRFAPGTPTPYVPETWIWERATGQWELRQPTNSPPQSQLSSLAYDPSRDRTILFGGYTNFAPSAITWEWDGTDWTQRMPTNTPPPRYEASIAFDFTTDTVVLFGGRGILGTRLDDVWDWNGVDWTQRTMVGPGPTPRSGATMTSRFGEVLVIGGVDDAGHALDELWTIQGNQWIQLPYDGPVADPSVHAVVDYGTDELVVFDPWSDEARGGVWSFGVPRARTVAFARGCAGSRGTPTLSGEGQPTLGHASYTLDASNVASGQPAAFLFGTGAARVDLPHGCRLLVPAAFMAPSVVAAPNDVATLPAGIPTDATLAGFEVYVQTVALDPSAGLTTSNALRLRIGR